MGVFPTSTVCTDSVTDIYFDHTWLAVTGGSYGSTTYYLDPSYKQYTTPTAGMNLATATGYSQVELHDRGQGRFDEVVLARSRT